MEKGIAQGTESACDVNGGSAKDASQPGSEPPGLPVGRKYGVLCRCLQPCLSCVHQCVATAQASLCRRECPGRDGKAGPMKKDR